MSNIIETIQKRHSVRKFKDESIDKGVILSIVEAARLSPSACNAQPSRFVAVTDKSLLKTLSIMGWVVLFPISGHCQHL